MLLIAYNQQGIFTVDYDVDRSTVEDGGGGDGTGDDGRNGRVDDGGEDDTGDGGGRNGLFPDTTSRIMGGGIVIIIIG